MEQKAEKFVAEYLDQMIKYALYRANGNKHLAEDVVQDVLQKMIEDETLADETLSNEGKFRLSMRMIRCRMIDLFRKDKRIEFRESINLEDGYEKFEEDSKRELSEISEDFTRHLAEFYNGLSDLEKNTFELRHHEQLETKEVSERLNISPSNVSTILSRTMGKLRNYLESQGISGYSDM